MGNMIIILFLFFECFVAYSQSYNNDHPIIDKDIKAFWDMHEFSAFKFPVKLEGDQFVYYSYQVWENGELKEDSNNIENILKDKTSFYRKFMNASKGGEYLRIYWKETDDRVKCNMYFGTSMLNPSFPKKGGDMHQTADRPAYGLYDGQRSLLCVRYSYNSGAEYINCAGDADAATTASKYDHVIAVFAQIITP